MPGKEYVPEEVNPGLGGAKSAKRQIIRPGPGESRPGPVGVHYPGPVGTQLRAAWRRIPARPDPPDTYFFLSEGVVERHSTKGYIVSIKNKGIHEK
jgi:hypothetical protein